MSGVLNPAPLDPRSQSYNGDECPQQRRRWWESLPPRHARRRATRAGETGRDGAGGDVREDPWPGTARVAPADFSRGLVLCWPYDVTISGRWCFAPSIHIRVQQAEASARPSMADLWRNDATSAAPTCPARCYVPELRVTVIK
jgi:hypothetical protein